MTDARVFIVSDDPAVRDALWELAASGGLLAETFPSLAAWHAMVPAQRRGCLVLDARARDLAGPERLASLTAICGDRPVLMMVDRGDVPTAVAAMRAGSLAVVEKPMRKGNLLERIRLAVATQTTGAAD